MRDLIGWLLVVLGVLASSLAAMSAAMAVTGDDRLTGIVGFGVLAAIMGCLGGARLLRRRRRTMRAQPTLAWDPRPGEGWLPQPVWTELPDVLPRQPRIGPSPPTPVADVPPDGLLRRLWLVRAELAFDQAGGMRTSSTGWIMLLFLLAGPALLVGAMLATADFTVEEQAATATILAWLIVGIVCSGERASRNPRRHFTLRRLQRQLEATYAVSPGPIPAGPTVRLGDPTPRYDPDRVIEERDSRNAARP
jgi:hypothetical protein